MSGVVDTAKRWAKPVLRALTAPIYRGQPVAAWPPYFGRIQDINVPRGVIPHARRMPAGEANINNLLHLLNETREIKGDITECGVYRGASLVTMAVYVRQQGLKKTLHGFDSFEGFAESITRDMAMGGEDLDHKHPGGMNETSYDLVAGKVKRFGLTNVELHKGFFEHTLPGFSHLTFSFAHLDCDAYDPYKTCLEFFYPRMSAGGIILLDEYDDPPWPGCNAAVDEFLADKPERLQRIALDNYEKSYFVKK